MPFSSMCPRRADYDIFVWKPGAADTWPIDYRCGGFGCLLQERAVKGRGKDEYLEFTARKRGTYYFHVNHFSGRGSYTLRGGSSLLDPRASRAQIRR